MRRPSLRYVRNAWPRNAVCREYQSVITNTLPLCLQTDHLTQNYQPMRYVLWQVWYFLTQHRGVCICSPIQQSICRRPNLTQYQGLNATIPTAGPPDERCPRTFRPGVPWWSFGVGRAVCSLLGALESFADSAAFARSDCHPDGLRLQPSVAAVFLEIKAGMIAIDNEAKNFGL